MSVCFLQLSVAMTTRREHPMLSGRCGRSRTRGGWWWTAHVWEREVDASRAPPEVRKPLSVSCFPLILSVASLFFQRNHLKGQLFKKSMWCDFLVTLLSFIFKISLFVCVCLLSAQIWHRVIESHTGRKANELQLILNKSHVSVHISS